MKTNKDLLRSMLESATRLRALQNQDQDADGNVRLRMKRSLDVDVLLAQQMSEALEGVSFMDVAFLVQFIEDVVDFRETFVVVQRAMERAQNDMPRHRKDTLRKRSEAFPGGAVTHEISRHTAY